MAGGDTEKMRDMTRELADREPPMDEGSAVTPTQASGGQQPLDAQMAQQVHQPSVASVRAAGDTEVEDSGEPPE